MDSKLTSALDIPVIGTEVLQGSHYLTAECIASGVIDMVRTDVSWKGGVTPVMKTAHLAESFGVQCELHTTIYHPLEVVNLHCCCAISNCEFFELLYPLSYMEFARTGSTSMPRAMRVPAAAWNRSRL
jgi:L-alanine-DL-glutamate epimerase-like enolase superfamily enzyme